MDAPTFRHRFALLVLQIAAPAVVLVALPYKAFDLDRYFVPKELVLCAAALLAGAAAIAGIRRLSLTSVDASLAGFLLLSVTSALFAINWWAAERAVAISA